MQKSVRFPAALMIKRIGERKYSLEKDDHLIQFLVEPSSYMHNSSKRCYNKFDKEKFKSDLGKVI